MPDTWTPAETALARRLFAEGKDAQQICEIFREKGIHRTHPGHRAGGGADPAGTGQYRVL